mgnify:FL=1
MTIKPFSGVENFHFTDGIATIKEKLSGMEFEEGERVFMGKRSKTIFVDDQGLDITFKHDDGGIESFELTKKSSASFEG